MLFHFDDFKAGGSSNRVGHIALVLGEHGVFDRFHQIAGLKRTQCSLVLGGGCIGILFCQIVEFLSLAGPFHQVFGLLLGCGHARRGIVAGGNQNLAQSHHLFADEFRLVLFVVLQLIGARNGDTAIHFFADHALGQNLILHLQLEIFKGLAGLFAHEVVKFIGVADFAL